jgi:hypothetical protein
MAARAISGTRRAFKELVDGTIRVQIDVDPDCRRDFLRIFPDIDTRVALAPIKPTAKAEADRPKGGELAKLAGILCDDPEFQGWLAQETETQINGAEDAATRVRFLCGVESRAELDHNAEAAQTFHHLIRLPWAAYKANA